MQVQTGIVAFCDILGYRDILKHSEPKDVARDVIDVLKHAKQDVNGMHTDNLSPNIDRTVVTDKLGHIEWISFSDTIALFHSYPDNARNADKYICWLVTIINLIYLFQHMLDRGLPIRGAISFGSFYHDGLHFAGVPIVDAHDLSEDLSLSAIALHDKASAELQTFNAFNPHSTIAVATRDYRTPCKSRTANFHLLYPYVPGTLITQKIKASISDYLTQAFCSHGKSLVNPRAKEIHQNTLAYYESIIARK
ncbi:MAG: hypothetical protein H7A43_11815 [Verrucomicrobia bacterium]|nr:hypothetical protein [Verrucomicrobiota bacterium]